MKVDLGRFLYREKCVYHIFHMLNGDSEVVLMQTFTLYAQLKLILLDEVIHSKWKPSHVFFLYRTEWCKMYM